eukprot:2171209-Pleurochrysis_carterae.AAC.1
MHEVESFRIAAQYLYFRSTGIHAHGARMSLHGCTKLTFHMSAIVDCLCVTHLGLLHLLCYRVVPVVCGRNPWPPLRLFKRALVLEAELVLH